jgi:hypothetical protein
MTTIATKNTVALEVALKPQMRGDKERKREAYFAYDDCLRDEVNKADGALVRVLCGFVEKNRIKL